MMAVLFPDWRYVVACVTVTLSVGLMASVGGGVDSLLLPSVLLAAAWAQDCVVRLRRWEASWLVPGYTLSTLAIAVGIVGTFVFAVTSVSVLAGNAAPAFGIAAMVGIILVTITYPLQLNAIGRTIAILILIAVGLLIPYMGFGSRFGWPDMAQPLIQWPTLTIAFAAVVLLKRRLDQPLGPYQPHERLVRQTRPWLYFRPYVAGREILVGGWLSSSALVDLMSVIFPVVIVFVAYAATIGSSHPWWLPCLTLIVFFWVYLVSLAPLTLMKGAGMWMSTAWQLGAADSRTAVGQVFVSRIVTLTAAAQLLVLLTVAAHALLIPLSGRWAGHQDLFDEALLLFAVSYAAFAWACFTHPVRTTRLKNSVGTIIVVCVIFLFVFYEAPTFGVIGRVGLVLLVVCSAALAVYAGGRALARIDFLPVTEE